MNYYITLGLFVEGNADARFLPPLIQRVAQEIFLENNKVVEIADILEQHVKKKTDYKHLSSEPEKIITVAQGFRGYNVLILHFDADGSSIDKAMQDHFKPANDLFQQNRLQGNLLCDYLVPVIPIRNIEAWMLADSETLITVFDTELTKKELGLTHKARQVEAFTDAKERFDKVLNMVNAKRRKKLTIEEIQPEIARKIDLRVLANVPSFKEFKAYFSHVLLEIVKK
jgi:hypothetical protein